MELPVVGMIGAKMAAKSRTLHLYSIHARASGGVLNYLDLVTRIAQLGAVQRQSVVGLRTVAVTSITDLGQVWRLRFVAGVAGEPAVFYDTATGQEFEEETGTRMSANSMWVFIDPSTRLVALERRRPGVSLLEIESAMEQMADVAGLGPSVRIDLHPVASEGFLEEIEKLDRIREATIVLGRPNYDWDDSASALAAYAAESDGARAAVTVNAKRGGSLATSQGIVRDIKEFARHPIAAMRSVKLRGNRSGEDRERTVSLDGHQERRFVSIEPGVPALDAISSAALDVLSETAQRIPTVSDGDIRP